jgi:hypothetical protein
MFTPPALGLVNWSGHKTYVAKIHTLYIKNLIMVKIFLNNLFELYVQYVSVLFPTDMFLKAVWSKPNRFDSEERKLNRQPYPKR